MADAGRVLVGELGCTACHASELPTLAAKGGPALAGIGTRVDRAWLRRFLAEPAAAAPGTTMPHALAAIPETDRTEVAAALAAYLATRLEPTPLPRPTGTNPMPHEFWNLGIADRGDALYHRVGCVACHAPIGGEPTAAAHTAAGANPLLDEEDLLEAGLPLPERPFASVPLEHVPAKYTRQGLTEFLMVPYHARPAGRMPDLKLLAAEAADIAAYLLGALPAPEAAAAAGADHPPTDVITAAIIARGREHFAALACTGCHDVGERLTTAAGPARPLADLDPRATGSCIAAAPSERPGAVHYPLDDAQRTAVIAAIDELARGSPPATPHAPTAPALGPLDVTLARLNCLGCHERDSRGGVGPGRRDWFQTIDRLDLGDEGRLPPRLTGVGARLQKPWLIKAVAGGVQLRPFMHVRMPTYAKEHVGPLPDWLRAADQTQPAEASAADAPAQTPATDDPDTTFAAAAAVLDAGCIQCHPLGGQRLPGVVGVNLAGVTRRVEPAWFHRLLRDPLAVRPGTKMPAFFGATIDPRILGGDAERQIAAVWAYLDRDTFEPVPPKLLAAAATDYELVPDARPIIQRTFMPRAGTHAVAVGFPAGVHLAFDGDRCRLAEAWRDRFLDSRGSWLIRSAPPTDPLGTDIVAIDIVPPLAMLTAAPAAGAAAWPITADEVRFLGYSLDAAGVPTFRAVLGGVIVAERIEPDDAGDSASARGLRRRLTIETGPSGDGAAAPRVWFCPLAGEDLAVAGMTASLPGRGLTATLVAAGLVETGPTPGDATRADDAVPQFREAVVRPVDAGPGAPGALRAWTVPLGPPGTSLEVRYRW